jgi:hypothetical protein
MGAVSARRLISVILVMWDCSGTRRQQRMVSVCVRMGILRMIRRFVSYVLCLGVRIVRRKMFVVFVTLRCIECKPRLMASVCAKPLIHKILRNNVCYAQLQGVLIVRAKTPVPSAILLLDSMILLLMESANVWPQSIWIQTHARTAQRHCSGASYAAMVQHARHATHH